jgi:hypothetical protein
MISALSEEMDDYLRFACMVLVIFGAVPAGTGRESHIVEP